jgi:hypothetical protein
MPRRLPVPVLAVSIVPLALPLALVAAGGEADPVRALLVLLVGVGLALGIRLVGRSWTPWVASLALAGALAYVAATAIPTPVIEALTGAGAIGLVVWIAVSQADGPRLADALRGLLFPTLALGIALSVSFLLPVARQSIGIATVLLVGALGILAWSVLRGVAEPAPSPSPPSL